jgi:outer membrane receptor protein involved in Fe transport
VDQHQVTSDERSSQDYSRVYPSLHLARKLNERQNLTFSYARRVQRPFWQDMNPFLKQLEINAFRSGNPDLRPSEIDSLDLGWSYAVGATSLGASIYGRRQYDRVTYLTTLISSTAVLNRPENLGDNRSGGFELTASGKLGARFGYNLAANAFYDEIDATNLGFPGTRSTITRDAKAALDWQLGAKDLLQINLASNGKRLTPQGYQLGSNALDLGFRHKLGPGLSLSATLSDVFETRRDRGILYTPALSDRVTVRPNGRIAWVGLTWTMVGNKEKPAENFEYEN